MPLLDANGIPNKPIRCDGLIGAHTQAKEKVPLAHRRWFCESATCEWIFYSLFETAPLNGYTHPANPMTKLTKQLQRLWASFVPPQARLHFFSSPWRRSWPAGAKTSSMTIGLLPPCLVACQARPVCKSRESEIKNKTSRAGTVPDFMGVRDLLAR